MELRKLKIISGFLTVVLLIASTAYVSAQDKGDMSRIREMGMGEKMAMVEPLIMMADYLGLSSDQIKQLNELSIDSQINSIKDTSAVEVSELQLRKLLSAHNADKQAINNLIDELYNLKKTQRKNMIDTHFKAMAILTPEQFEKFKEFMAKMGRMSGTIRQKMMGMPKTGMVPEQQMNMPPMPEQSEPKTENEGIDD